MGAPTPLPSSLPSPRRTKSTRSTVTSGLSVPSSTTRVAEMPEQRPRLERRSESFQEHWKDCKPKDRSASPILPLLLAGNFAEPLPRCNQLYRLFGKHSLNIALLHSVVWLKSVTTLSLFVFLNFILYYIVPM